VIQTINSEVKIKQDWKYVLTLRVGIVSTCLLCDFCYVIGIDVHVMQIQTNCCKADNIKASHDIQ
jgi:hypothetical protein